MELLNSDDFALFQRNEIFLDRDGTVINAERRNKIAVNLLEGRKMEAQLILDILYKTNEIYLRYMLV